ncbi:MAG: isopenicillin-N epimerase [Chloroflexota bacterium]|jgi:isopenicillin-N epimerase|nr:isopenicillin-N epimerase [Chloroflexota bacterium]
MPSEFARHWTLDPTITFLNHGSFGATPRPVLAAQDAWRERMEREPVAFFVRDLEPALDQARAALAGFIGADAEDLAFIPNATAGVNTVARSLALEPGDEILATDHGYNAVGNILRAAADRASARVVTVPLPFPGSSAEAATELILGAVSPHTRLAVVDHVTSTTALVLPIERIVRALAERGIDTLVDGAHVPGMLDLDVTSIGAAYYTGNGHKWLCSPKGAGFLHVRRDLRPRVRPLAISHGANSPRTDRAAFRLEHDWTGTADPSAYLSIPAAIDFGAGLLDGGWPALRDRNRAVALRGRDLVCSALGIDAPAPDTMVGSMATIALAPEHRDAPVDDGIADDALHAALEAQGIQVMVAPWPQRPDGGPWRRVIRVSAAAYVAIEDVERLAQALPGALAAVAD